MDHVLAATMRVPKAMLHSGVETIPKMILRLQAIHTQKHTTQINCHVPLARISTQVQECTRMLAGPTAIKAVSQLDL